MCKTHHSGTTFWSGNVETVHVVVVRSTCPRQKCKKTDGLGACLDVQMLFGVPEQGFCTLPPRHCITLHAVHSPPVHYITLQRTDYNYSYTYNCATFYTTPPHITLHSIHYATTHASATTLHKFQDTTTTIPLHNNYNYSCTTPHDIQQL